MQDIPIRELLLEDLKLLRVWVLFYIFPTDPIWLFFTHSLNLLEQDVLLASPSPWLKSFFSFPPFQCTQTTTYCLSGHFPSRLYPSRSPEACRGSVFISQLWMSENTFARLTTSQFACQESSSCQVQPQLSTEEVFVLTSQRFSNTLVHRKRGT